MTIKMGKIRKTAGFLLGFVLIVCLCAGMAFADDSGENTIPTSIRWISYTDPNVKISNTKQEIKLTGKTDTVNHTPAAFTYDTNANCPKSDLKDDRFYFTFKLTNAKMADGAVDKDAYFFFAFRNSVASAPTWESNFAIFLLFFGDKVQVRISDGTSDENQATYITMDGWNYYDGKEHTAAVKVNDNLMSFEIVLDEDEENRKISYTSDDDRETNDEFDETGGNMFLAHYVTAEISQIKFVNSKEAPAEGGQSPDFVPDDETEVTKPNAKKKSVDLWVPAIYAGGGILLAGIAVAAYFLIFKS